MNGKKVFFIRFDADEVVGMGHFSRCYALGRKLSEFGENVIFVSKHISRNIEQILREANQQYLKLPDHLGWSQETAFIKGKFPGGCSGFILDIAAWYAFADLPAVTGYLNELRKIAKTILLDGMGGNALSTKVPSLIDVIVVPYFGATELMPKLKQETVYLIGPEYYVFSSEYSNGYGGERDIRETADRVLVTLGGADPLSVTVKVIEALRVVQDLKFDVRVVLGPSFSPELKGKVKNTTASSRHHFTVIDSPESLLDHMLWCDVAITSSGLTKYELAVTGTPALQISFNRDHAKVNEYFLRHGSIKHAGVHSDVTVESLASALKDLLGDHEGRKKMSRLGQNLLDTHGVNRIIEIVRGNL